MSVQSYMSSISSIFMSNAVFIIRSANPKQFCLGLMKYNCNSCVLSFIAVIRHPV